MEETTVLVQHDDGSTRRWGLNAESRTTLVLYCINALSRQQHCCSISYVTAYRIVRLLGRLLREYPEVVTFMAQEGLCKLLAVEILNEEKYHVRLQKQRLDLVNWLNVIVQNVLESPRILEDRIREEIVSALTDLSRQYGSISQNRKTPRLLLTKTYSAFYRSPTTFVKVATQMFHVNLHHSSSVNTYHLSMKAGGLPPKSSTLNMGKQLDEHAYAMCTMELLVSKYLNLNEDDQTTRRPLCWWKAHEVL
jgi:hypothetical protein